MNHSVTIYTTSTCVFCSHAKEFFKQHAVEYTEKNVGLDRNAGIEMVVKSGQMGVPVIDIDGTIVVGYQPNKFAELLQLTA